MLTLADINTLTNSKDGDIFSDLFKDVCGFRPRGELAQFESIEAFEAEYERLVKELVRQNEEEELQQGRNFTKFVARVEETMQLVQGTDRERAIEIIADAEGVSKDEFEFYGLEILEYRFDLKYGSIAKWLSE
jgi:hypothetical protein